MKKVFLLLGLPLLALTFGCSDDDEQPVTTVAVAVVTSTDSIPVAIGTVTFTDVDGTVTMKATISGISEGDHAIHVHETGDCSDSGGAAGGHWNPTGEEHGEWDSASFHRGDIGNITIDSSGTGTIERTTTLWCVGCDNDNKNVVGKAIIIHEGPDDFSSQPSGAAGPRIGCGVIELEQ